MLTLALNLVNFFRDKVSVCFPGWPVTQYVDQAGPELTCLCFPRAGIKCVCQHCPDISVVLTLPEGFLLSTLLTFFLIFIPCLFQPL